MKYFACEEHIELAIDHAVDELEAAPTIETVKTEEKLSTTCSFCHQQAHYVIFA